MSIAKYKILVEKSLEACLAAIEVYNKPNFQFREETFSILMLSAWEILLKARVMQEGGGKLRAIQVFERKMKQDGTPGKRQQRKINRSGNAMTISLDRAANLVANYSENSIDQSCLDNLNLLKEIRDNSVHLLNVSPGLGRKLQEVGAATLRNYVAAAECWFDINLDRYNFYLMPLAFHSPPEVVDSLHSNMQPVAVRGLLKFIAEAEQRNLSDNASMFSVTMKVQIKLERTSGGDAAAVRVTHDDPDAIPITMSEENIREAFPWDYGELTDRLKSRYSDFLQNPSYHDFRKCLEDNKKYCHIRYLDPSKPDATKKKYYSPNILKEFDSRYMKRNS